MLKEIYFREILLKLVLFAALFLIVLTQKSYAYLDPGTGSFVFQLLLAGFIGGLFIFRLFWKRIVSLIGKLFRRKDSFEE